MKRGRMRCDSAAAHPSPLVVLQATGGQAPRMHADDCRSSMHSGWVAGILATNGRDLHDFISQGERKSDSVLRSSADEASGRKDR